MCIVGRPIRKTWRHASIYERGNMNVFPIEPVTRKRLLLVRRRLKLAIQNHYISRLQSQGNKSSIDKPLLAVGHWSST
jgi:hypothetical protein